LILAFHYIVCNNHNSLEQTYTAILKDLKAKKYAPIYLLHADDAYFIDVIVDYIEKEVLDEGERSFNQVVLYGKETHFKQILDQAMQFPMMAERRVVIVKEAQELSSMDGMEGYFKNPSEQTLLVLAHKHKKLDKRKKIYKAIAEHAVILKTKKIYDNQIPAFVMDIAKEKQLRLPTKVAHMIAENLGSNLSKIANELDKLSLNLQPGSEVTLELVEKYIGISKDYNVFELQKAIGNRDKKKAYQITRHFARNSKTHPIQMNIGALYNYFSKLFVAKKYERASKQDLASAVGINPFFVEEYRIAAKNYDLAKLKRAFMEIHKMDMRCKGVDARHMDLMGIYQEFLFKVFN